MYQRRRLDLQHLEPAPGHALDGALRCAFPGLSQHARVEPGFPQQLQHRCLCFCTRTDFDEVRFAAAEAAVGRLGSEHCRNPREPGIAELRRELAQVEIGAGRPDREHQVRFAEVVPTTAFLLEGSRFAWPAAAAPRIACSVLTRCRAMSRRSSRPT